MSALKKTPTQKDVASFDVTRAQRRLDYLTKRRPNDPEIKRLQGQIKKAGSNQPAGPAAPAEPTRQELTQEGMQAGAKAYQDIVGRFRGSDPYQMQAQYQPIFTQEMERARQNIMSQFERRNAEEFVRQQQDVQRQIAERGLDPNSEAAQALMKQLNVRQDLARQEAMGAAEQAAQGVQQQMFGQSYQTAMMPYEQIQAIQAPYMAGINAQYSQEQITQQQQYDKELAALKNKHMLQQIKATPRGGGGGAQQPDYFSQYYYGQYLPNQYGQTTPQPSPISSGMSNLMQGAGAQIVSNLQQPKRG